MVDYYSRKLSGTRLRECYRIAPPDRVLELGCGYGRVLFSSYSDRFWEHRLRWFELQAERGLVGEIDIDATGDGTIACLDGFRSGRMRPDGFRKICAELGAESEITEVDRSSVFCQVVVS